MPDSAPLFECPNCGEASMPDEVGEQRCPECGATIITEQNRQPHWRELVEAADEIIAALNAGDLTPDEAVKAWNAERDARRGE